MPTPQSLLASPDMNKLGFGALNIHHVLRARMTLQTNGYTHPIAIPILLYYEVLIIEPTIQSSFNHIPTIVCKIVFFQVSTTFQSLYFPFPTLVHRPEGTQIKT